MPKTRPRRTPMFRMIGAYAVSLLVACDMHSGRRLEEAEPGSVTIDAINGVVHVSNHGMGEWTPQTAWRAREIFRLGGREEPVEQLFTNQLLGAQIGPQGHVNFGRTKRWLGGLTAQAPSITRGGRRSFRLATVWAPPTRRP